jgi:protein-S-isoprenylcysteine O-methyltransferase Ste14
MGINPSVIHRYTLEALFFCWAAFAMVFLLRRKPPQPPESRRDRVAFVGIILQGCGYWVVWGSLPTLRHRGFILPSLSAQIALSVFTLALAVASVWLVAAAIRTLGKQWAVAARLIEGHRLITNGPYRFVRNPIYAGMLGMLVATGLALDDWTQILIGIVLFAIGLVIRVRSEEKLLRSAFGQEFEDYARRVPAVLPGIY